MYQNLKRKVYHLLDPEHSDTIWEKLINAVIIFLIIANTIAIILETVTSIYTPHKRLFIDLELFTVAVFSVEYLLRVWSCTVNDKYKHPIAGRLKYMVSVEALIDLIAILPFYLPMLHADFMFVRILRLFRFFRFLKMSRYMHASRVMKKVFASKKEELILSFTIIMFLVVIASSIMYFVEHEHQPDRFSSIPETMLWSVATFTTIGYGDVYPVTPLGKTLAALISILGIGMFALPAGILAAGFSEEFSRKRQSPTCPHCGKEIH